MISMDQSILALYREGRITRETALEYADNPETMRRSLG
jgi:twitching motility protein PilT